MAGLALVFVSTACWAGISKSDPQPSAKALHQTPTEVKPFDKDEAWQYLVKQCDMGPRKPGTPAQVKCRDYIEAELKQSCENVTLQPFHHVWSSNGQDIKFWNVIGEQNWKDAKVRVVLVAHWDTRPTADQEADPVKRDQPILGADDGASGVAVLLELAKTLKQVPLNVGVKYLFVDGEDLGPKEPDMYLGAKVFAQDPSTPKPDYGILLDMIGNKGVHIPEEDNSRALAPKLEDAFYDFAEKIGEGSTFPKIVGDSIEDDHLWLNQGHIPTIDLIDFDYAPWHTLGDTVDKCSPESLDKVGIMLQKWLTQPTPYSPG